MDGPSQSIYSGGHFRILLEFPTQFPFKPPTVSFQTKIWHPNVTNDDKGSMCLGILRPDVWKPASTVSGVLDLIRTLLIEPDVDDAVETSIADQLKSDKKAFEKQAKEWVKKYASGK
jgi:ubiquitin-conjugating enzyme E2 D/E